MRWSSLSPLVVWILIPSLVLAQGGNGQPCTAADGTITGETPTCDTQFCRQGTCSYSPRVEVGDPCVDTSQCAGAETAYEYPPSCGGAFGAQTTCGGESASCYALDGTGIGPSPICVSGQCRDYQCLSLLPSGPGGNCQGNYQCSGRLYCQNSICTDVGLTCTSSVDNTITGTTDQCFAGFCRQGSCAAFPSSDVGESCSSSEVCVGAETANEYPPFCGGAPNAQPTCGGESTSCYALDNTFDGPSPICASGQCRSGQCGSLTPSGPGETCSSGFNYQCSGRLYCQNLICIDAGLSCLATDQTITGSTDQCSSGFCRQGSCAAFPSSNVGDSCTDSNSCIGAETANEYPPFCGGAPNAQPTCGGESASCYGLDGTFNGASPICASGQCRDGQCGSLIPSGPGEACPSGFNYQCSGRLYCQNLICTDAGLSCLATDQTITGSTDQCSSGFCRQGSCAAFPSSNVGDSCTDSNSCIGAETANEYPPFCGGAPNAQPTCGGESASCYGLDGTFNGPSPICASGQCRNGQCGSLTPSGPGETCPSGFNYQCSGRLYCQNSLCTDVGLSCVSTDQTITGSTDECFATFCRQGSCAAFPTSNLGEACSSDSVCIGAETYSDVPAYCAGPPGVPATCGGGSAFCYTLDGQFTGFSPTCASGQCLNGQCKRIDPVGPGQACQGDFDCGGGITCVNGFCTGGEGTCAADDNNPQAIGTSDDCTSNFCRAGQCSNIPAALLGDICDEDRDCAGSEDNSFYRSLLNCGQSGSGSRRCGSGGAACVALNGSPSGSAPDLCISGQCFNYGCTDSTASPGLRKRVDLPSQQVMQKRLCPKGFQPCPLYPKGYECVDVMNDIESCGGCIGRNMPGIDCSADVHAAAVSCVAGKCVISACEKGYFVAPVNNTCVAE